MEISDEDITAGIKAERIVIIKSKNPNYNGKAVRIRALRAQEFKSLTARVAVRKDNLGDAYALSYAVCEAGVLTPIFKARLAELDEDIVSQVGQEILSTETASPKEVEDAVEDFSTAREGKNS